MTPGEFSWAKEGGTLKGLRHATAELRPSKKACAPKSLHLGPYDDRPATVALLDAFIAEQGLGAICRTHGAGRHHLEDLPAGSAPHRARS